MDDTEFNRRLASLREALSRRDRARIRGELTGWHRSTGLRDSPERVNAPQIEELLSLLKGYTEFAAILALVAAAQAGQPTWSGLARRGLGSRGQLAYAQALIDTGEPTSALDFLDDAGDDPELMGLRGRAYKELYLRARPTRRDPRAHDLKQAVAWYQRGHDCESRSHWHGVNLAGLLVHGSRRAATNPARRALIQARRVLEETLSRARAATDPWAPASVAECHIGLALLEGGVPAREHLDEAERALAKYLAPPGRGRFALAGTLRNWSTLWELGDSPGPKDDLPGHARPLVEQLMATLQRALAACDGATIELDLHAVWEGHGRVPAADWLATAQARAKAVGQVVDDRGATRGSAVLLNPSRALTCAHVLDKELAPAGWTVSFGDRASSVRISSATRPDPAFDAAVLHLEERVPDIEPLEAHLDRGTKLDSERAYVIGFPDPGLPKVSLHGSAVLAWDEHALAYRTPTAPGYSGGGVFDERWRLIGLHQRGSTRLADDHLRPLDANQAVRLTAILGLVGVGAAAA